MMPFKDYINKYLKDLCIEVGTLNEQKHLGPNTPKLNALIEIMLAEGSLPSLALIDATMHIGHAAMAVVADS